MSNFQCPLCGEMQSAFYLDVHMYRDHNLRPGEGYDAYRDCFFCGERLSETDMREDWGGDVYGRHYSKCTAYAACRLAGSVVYDHRMS